MVHNHAKSSTAMQDTEQLALYFELPHLVETELDWNILGIFSTEKEWNVSARYNFPASNMKP